jgi:hypothetical protein
MKMAQKKYGTQEEQQAAWYIKNAERLKEKSRQRYRDNAEEAKRQSKIWISNNRDKHALYVKTWETNNPDAVKNLHYRKVGWTLELFKATLVQQNNCCALCGKLFTADNKPCADHEHIVPPKPRGILHISCNTRLSAIEEEEFREQASAYLRKWGK